jgi:hypothetical protein
VILADSAASAQQQTNYSYVGLGGAPCAKFGEMYKNDPSNAELMFFIWAQGFMSGTNSMLLIRSQGKRSTNLALWNIDRQKQYLRIYCSRNPLAPYVQGVFALFDLMTAEEGLPNRRQ